MFYPHETSPRCENFGPLRFNRFLLRTYANTEGNFQGEFNHKKKKLSLPTAYNIYPQETETSTTGKRMRKGTKPELTQQMTA